MTDTDSLPHEAFNGEDWAGEMGVRWLANLTGFEGTIAPIGTALLERAAYKDGERVLDLGCGGGATTLSIARTVGSDGLALGLDISPDLTNFAARRAADARLINARFTCADAGYAHLPEAPFDRLFSRFGCMFFADPVAAFTNLHRMLRHGARIDLAVWAAPAENPWMSGAMAIARSHVEMAAPIPRTPGPFAFEERDYLADTLEAAGFSDIDIDAHTGLCRSAEPASHRKKQPSSP